MISDIFFIISIFLVGVAIGFFADICLRDGIMCMREECEYRTYEERRD
jgi:hypothetical protein